MQPTPAVPKLGRAAEEGAGKLRARTPRAEALPRRLLSRGPHWEFLTPKGAECGGMAVGVTARTSPWQPLQRRPSGGGAH